MKIIFALAWNTFREWMREKFFWTAIALSLFLMGLSLVLGQMTFAEEQKILSDFGLSSIELSMVFVAAISGAYVMAKEIEKQTCLLLLSRPLTRTQFLAGKWLGLVLLNLLLFISSTFVLWVLISGTQTVAYILVIFSIFLKSTTILSFTLFCSLIVRPLLSLMCGFGLYFFGHWLGDLSFFAEKSQSEVYQITSEALHFLIPQFYRFNWKNYYFLQKDMSLEIYSQMLLHLLAWILIYLFCARWLFQRKDIL